jgi:DNA-binding PadR family transcriptional regulator
MRLGGRKLLESKWQEAPEEWRPPRHLYRLTAAGIRWARQQQLDEPDNAAARAATSRA